MKLLAVINRILAALVFVSVAVWGTKSVAERAGPRVYTIVDTPPILIGGLPSLQAASESYSQSDRRTFDSNVVVQVIVDRRGSVVESSVLRSSGEQCDAVARRVADDTKWTPGVHRGKKVLVRVTVPVPCLN